MQDAPAIDLRDRDWEILLRSIENGNCVLLLGPNLDVLNKDGDRLNLVDTLAGNLRQELGHHVPDTCNFGLVTQLFENEMSRDDLEIELVRFYQDNPAQSDDPAFAALASLPFRAYLSLRHDNALQDALRQAGREARVEHYDFNGDRRDTLAAGEAGGRTGALGTVERPLVYNLLGTLQSDALRGSAVITENDLIRFLEAIVSENPKLPTDMTNHLKNKNFLFIGFGMQNFYLRILLHVLDIARSTKSFAFENPSEPQIDESVLFFRSTGFNTLKIMESDPVAFLAELRERWDQKFPDGSFAETVTAAKAATIAEGPSVFVSYVSEDKAQAEELTRLLEEQGLDPWLDTDGLRVGDRWNDKLEDAISSDVDFFIVLQSHALANRRETYVHREVNLALERQRMRPPGSPFIFPIVIEPEAERLDAITRAKIQSMKCYDLHADTPALAKEIRREHARWQKR